MIIHILDLYIFSKEFRGTEFQNARTVYEQMKINNNQTVIQILIQNIPRIFKMAVVILY